MATLNKAACDAMLAVGVNAATDVTGFGLLGHLREICAASRVGARIESGAVPLLRGALELAVANAPGGSKTNLGAALAANVDFGDDVADAMCLVLADAQTSGGLLISVDESRAPALLGALRERGIVAAAEVGRITSGATIEVR